MIQTNAASDDHDDETRVNQFLAAQRAAVLEIADQGLLSLSSLVDSGSVDVSPRFQRRDRWDAEKQSLLIESFLANIPVPPVYLAEDLARLGTYAVIDGKQRLTAISTFFANKLVLRGLVRLPSLNGLRYTQLPEGIRVPLGMKNLRVTTLLRQSSEELKHEVFLRLNTGGEVLNAQEIRNVAYRGPLNDLIYKLAESSFLRQQFKVIPPASQAFRQMTDAELVLRFLTLSHSWTDFRGGLREAMDRFMMNNRFIDSKDQTQLVLKFEHCIGTAEAIWGADAFKRPGRDQALAGLYDAQMIALSAFRDEHREILVRRRDLVHKLMIKLFQDAEFDEAVRRATNTPSRLQSRTQSMISLFLDVCSS